MKKDKIIKKAGKIIGKKAGDVFNELANEAGKQAIDTGAELIDDASGKIKDIGKDSIHTLAHKFGSMVHKKINPGKELPLEDAIIDSSMPEDEGDIVVKRNGPGNSSAIDADDYLAEPVKEESRPDEEETIDISTDQEDEKFVDTITSDTLVSGIKGIATPGDALSAVDDIIKMTGRVEMFREGQKTKRTAIEAEKEVALAKLDAQKELLMAYLDKTFDERKQNFKKYFDVIDDALAKGNTQQLAMGLNSINELAQSSPFKDLANIDQVGKALEDKNHEWDF